MTRDWIQFRAGIAPDDIAIVVSEDNKSYSYGHINNIGNKGAAYLQSLELIKGDRVAVLAKNSIELIYLFSIAQKTGIVLVPLNYRLTAYEIANLYSEIQPKLFLATQCMEPILEYIDDVRDLKEFFRTIDRQGHSQYNPVESSPEDSILMLFTSGSSGIPRAVLYTRKMMFWNSVNTMLALKINSSTSTVVCMPPFHTGGWNVLLTPLLHLGGCVILVEKFDAGKILDLLSENMCSIFMGVPTMLKMMSENEKFGSTNLSLLDYIIVGGEAMPLALINTYHERGISIRQGYGMTEAGPNLTSLHEHDAIRKIGSIGKPNMYVQLRIQNERGQEADVNEKGEMLIKGPITFNAYYNNQEETDKTLIDGWVHTGDVAIRDEEGFIYIVDRIKNMFISGGENVYPLEIESVLKSHPEISEAAVIGVPDDRWGETGCAIVSLNPECTLDFNTMRSYCMDKLSKYKIPTSLYIVDTLPKTETGKIDRKKLRVEFGLQS